MFAFMVKKMLPGVKTHARQEYDADKMTRHTGQLRHIKTRDGFEAEYLYFSAGHSQSPLVIDLYGGGYIGGNVYKQVPLCERYRDTLYVNTAALSYRYGPDYRHPTAVQDIYDGICELIDDSSLDFDRENIILEGHSAGAHLVVSTLLYAQSQKRKLRIKAMILDYPVMDTRLKTIKKMPKVKYSLAPLVFVLSYYGYFGNELTASQPIASPILASDEALRILPPVYINTCEYDNLKYSAQDFAERLNKLGVVAEIHEVEGAVHGYVESCSNDSMKSNKTYSQEMIQKQYESYEKTFMDFCKFIQCQTGQ